MVKDFLPISKKMLKNVHCLIFLYLENSSCNIIEISLI